MSNIFNLACARPPIRLRPLSASRGLALLVLGLLATHGVRAQKVTMEFDKTADFSKYKTFAIRDGRLNSANPALNSPLVIDLRDPMTRSLVWRAIAAEEKSDATKIEGKLDSMVKKSIDKYPPKK